VGASSVAAEWRLGTADRLAAPLADRLNREAGQGCTWWQFRPKNRYRPRIKSGASFSRENALKACAMALPHHLASTAPAQLLEPVLARLLALGRPAVMGILNVTPDSFSDGGRFIEPAIAIGHANRMAKEGADVLDVGAESTRPYGGAVPVGPEEERDRLRPVLPGVMELGLPVSIDTIKAKVAAFALEAGAAIVNDVWGLQRDPDMARVVAEHRVPVIVMHNRERADPAIDIVADVVAFFERSLDIAARAGIAPDRIVLDPGIGFGKTPEQSIAVLARLDAVKAFGLPFLVGASRKRFINSVVASPPDRRLGGSIAAHLLAVQAGAAIVRVHDVAETVQALRVSSAIAGAR
jgi:dihydropteroate synthase